MKTPDRTVFGRSFGRLTIDKFLQRDYPEFYEYIISEYNFCKTTQERVYCYFNNIHKIPLCVCGNPVKFHGYQYGYSKFCCSSCASSDQGVQSKLRKTSIDRYGENYAQDRISHLKSECIKKYGVDNVMKLESARKKAQNTCLKRFGVDNAMKSEQIKQKSRETCLLKYGNPTYLGSEVCNQRNEEFRENSRKTCLKNYGVEYPTQSEEVKQKLSNTIQEKYGVAWSCMRKEAHNSRNSNSIPNQEFAQLLESNEINYEREFAINKLSYDFKIGDILVEINPSPTHNINWNPFGGKIVGVDYHLNKTKLANEHGYKCIHVWDWDDAQKVINIIQPNKNRIYARKCLIKHVSKKVTKTFLISHHLQGYCRGNSISYGLYYNGELVMMMTFGRPRYTKKYDYELVRMCTKTGCTIVGGASKLLKAFITEYNPNSIISYCDRSKFAGEVYEKLGFKLLGSPQPSCHWVNSMTKEHINHTLLLKLGFDKLFNTNYGKGVSNNDLMLKHRFVQVYDCGQAAYILNLKDKHD